MGVCEYLEARTDEIISVVQIGVHTLFFCVDISAVLVQPN